jgi:TPR repeat protein
LGIAYADGTLTKRNDLRALAWFRESVRNGNIVSYLNAADLLSHHTDDAKRTYDATNVPKNRLFAMANYLGAYQHGAFFLTERIQTLATEIRT